MPYKDLTVRRDKAREYTAAYRARVRQQVSEPPAPSRFCMLCGVDISEKRADAKFCSRAHKRAFSDKTRDHAASYARNIASRRAQALNYYHADIEKSRLKQRQRQKSKPYLYATNQAKRRAAKMKRTPSWLTEDDMWLIAQAYSLAALRTKMFGFPWHVDHIIPLQGDNVSGLHVPCNLQVIPGRDNVAKNNKFEVV